MSDFFKCECSHCGQSIEYPSEGSGQTVPCPTCEKPVTLPPENPSTEFGSIVIPAAPDTMASAPTQSPKEKRAVRTNLSKLTEETIRARTQKGDTPLHRAAKTGRISEIPRHLLTTELFMVTNYSFHPETPLNLAARYGHLDKVPPEFLTKETLTASTEYAKKESRTGPTPPRTMTPLHTAALYGHADQIPKEFLTPEFLFIEATGYRHTVLHYFALSKSLDLISKIDANSEVWSWNDSNGQTPRNILDGLIEREAESKAYVARVRSEPATEKQKEKLRFFGYAFDESISKGQASDAIDKWVRDFPEKDWAYYNRPATEEQLKQLREINKHPDCGPDEPFYDFENEGPVTYGKAKDLIQEWAGLRKQKYWEEQAAYQNSDEARIDEACTRIDAFRDVKREQVAKAWAVVKARMTDKSQQPDLSEIEDTMEELFSDFRKTARDGVTYQCKDCGGIFKARLPSVGVFNLSGSMVFYSEADMVETIIQCPSCGRDKSVTSLKVCKYICPHCSKECLVAKSQTGQQLKCRGCRKEFYATTSGPTIGQPTVRLMQYAEQPLGETSGIAPTKTQTQNLQQDDRPTKEQINSLTGGLKLDPKADISASKLDELLKLEGQPPQADDMALFARHGITIHTGDAFATYGVADLVRCFENMFAECGDYTNISMACVAASSDPAFQKATITLDPFDRFVFTWPKSKLKQWYRKGAE